MHDTLKSFAGLGDALKAVKQTTETVTGQPPLRSSAPFKLPLHADLSAPAMGCISPELKSKFVLDE